MEEIDLWTIQAASAWDIALKSKVLKADGRRVWNEFRSAYQWLITQMKIRVPLYSGAYPIWAWTVKPDLRRSGYAKKGTPLVCIHFRAKKERVLLSDFDKWHYVLNNYFLPADLDDDSAPLLYKDRAFVQNNVLIIESWERIFDLDEGSCVQAVTDRISLDQVKGVRRFFAR